MVIWEISVKALAGWKKRFDQRKRLRFTSIRCGIAVFSMVVVVYHDGIKNGRERIFYRLRI